MLRSTVKYECACIHFGGIIDCVAALPEMDEYGMNHGSFNPSCVEISVGKF